VNEQKDLDRLHDESMQRMRELALGNLQDDKQAFELEKYGIARTDAATDLLEGRGYDEGIAATTREQDITDAATQHKYDLEIEDRKTSGAISLAEAKANPDDWKAIKSEIISGYDNWGGAIYEKKDISFNGKNGKFYEQLGGKLLPYDLTKYLSENERKLAINPSQAMHWAQAKGGPESLPAWFKVKHENVYQALKRDYKANPKPKDPPLTPAPPPTNSGGDNGGGVISEAVKARKTSNPIMSFLNKPATELGPAVVGGIKKAPGAAMDLLNYETSYGQ